jgi:hypothetical protein
MSEHDSRSPGAEHVEINLMARLLTGHAQDEDVYQRLLPHMVGQCPECRQLLAELEELRREAAAPDALIAATEWPAAPGLWGRLAPLSFDEQLRAAAADETFHTWGLCRLLQVKSGGEARKDPAAAGRLAQLALVISEHLAPGYDPDWVRDLRALALACLGNARRLLREPGGAADAFAAARVERQAGTGDPAVEAEVLVQEALLLRDQEQFAAASGLLERASECLAEGGRSGGDAGRVELRALIVCALHESCCAYLAGDADRNLAIVREAAALAEHQLLGHAADARVGDAGARLAGEAWWQLQFAQDAEVEVSMRRAAAAADPCHTPPQDPSDVS